MAYNERLENPTYEIVNGKEVMMSPASTMHNRIQMRLCVIIGDYLRGKRCEIFSETEVRFDSMNRYIPDLLIICDRDKIKENYIDGAPEFVIEILSPSTKKRDIGVKKNVYEHFGVKEYWIISPKEKSIEVYYLKDGKFELDNVYNVLEDWEDEALTEQERAEHRLKLKVSLYNDLEIEVKDIFEDMI